MRQSVPVGDGDRPSASRRCPSRRAGASVPFAARRGPRLRMMRAGEGVPRVARPPVPGGGARTVSRVAIVTDSASDLPPDVAARSGVTVVPLFVSFGAETFRPGVDLTTDEFWVRMTAPDAPFPTTAAASPGDFASTYQAAFDAGAESVVCITVSGDLSGTLKSATIGAAGLAGPRDPRRGLADRVDGPRDARPDRRRARRRGPVGRGDRRGARGAQGEGRPVRRPGHARVPQARRPDQRGPGGGRDHALDQADHHGRGRGRGERGPGAHPGQGPRARPGAPDPPAAGAGDRPPHDPGATSRSSGTASWSGPGCPIRRSR